MSSGIGPALLVLGDTSAVPPAALHSAATTRTINKGHWGCICAVSTGRVRPMPRTANASLANASLAVLPTILVVSTGAVAVERLHRHGKQ